ncbi:hypothetical protein MPTA5024_12945 [Microbispora sp. ATCC PTA-5024]|nr:hypothetical protein MPTA5024_12945 [Microbispora sp. ATCC PTA-5024]
MDEMSLAGAALRGAPWRAATIAGGAVAATSLVLGVILPGPPDLTWALCSGISLFAWVAAIGAIARPHDGDRVTRQARLWALRHPWRFSLYPGLGAAALMIPVQIVVDREGVFGAVWDAAWGGLLVLLVTAVITFGMKGRAQAS